LPPPPAVIPDFVTVTGERVNVRNRPLISSETQVGTLRKLARLPVTGEDGDWWKVELFVSKDWAKP
jgi:hypothetical protein